MKTLYLDIFSGISGDMFIGAMIDLGVDAGALERELLKLNLDGYHLHTKKGVKQSIAGTKFDVHLNESHGPHHHSAAGEAHHAHAHDHVHGHGHSHSHSHDQEHAHKEADHHHEGAHDHGHRGFTEIRKMIEASNLSDWVKQKAVAVFHRIAVAEGAIHGIPAEEVHFHEVGAIDSIVDIVGACVALEMAGKPRVLAAPVIEGRGTVRCAHGAFPIPAPATLAILSQRQVPLSQCDEPHELVTPTGAALLAEFCESFGPMQDLAAERIGFGLGTRENKTRPNVLRAILGESTEQSLGHDWETDSIAVIESNLDNLNPEVLGNVLEHALERGALDAFHTPIQMKKNRPGVLFTILCERRRADEFSELLLRETTALGVRRSTCERRKLKREFTAVQTPYGEVSVKIGKLNGQIIQRSPEFESCRKLAEKTSVPLKEIYAAAVKAAR
jgi:uncharacterized protein (TIGR00299 family) protein